MSFAAAGKAPDPPDAHGDRLEIALHEPLPRERVTGPGQFLVVSGECRAPGAVVEALAVSVGERSKPAELSPAARGVSFWQAVLVPAEAAGTRVPVSLEARLRGGGRVRRELGAVHCRAVDWQPAAAPGSSAGLVAICMATYAPALEAFARQIDSIRAQDHGNWLCIVNDDGSDAETWASMQACAAGDARFVFFQNPENLGFYRNFEKLLSRVPPEAEYVAFSDQDDAWRADKLSRLIAEIRTQEANLVYSDMRIVDAQGREIAGSYWVNRRNEYRDLRVVLVANTVTGAASLFRRDLLPALVPFPARVGDAFHDHWLACVALATGRVAYVDAPLYDYYQYGSSVIGHCDFVRFSPAQRIASLFRFGYRMCRPSIAKPLLKGKYASALAVYRGECRRLRLVEDTIRLRCRLEPGRARRLRHFDGGIRSVLRLLWLHALVLVRGQTTDDAELRLAMGEAARLVERYRLRRRHADH